MLSMVPQRSAHDERSDWARGRLGSPARPGWMGLTLGLIALDLEALVFLAALYPFVEWFSQTLIRYSPAAVTTIAMLALGGPPAIAGLVYAGAQRPSGWRGAPAIVGLAVCSLGLAIPISYAAFAFMYLRGLI